MLRTENALPREGEYFDTPDAFFGQWGGLIAATTSDLFKLETKQSYQEPGNPSFEAFLAGDLASARELAWQVRQENERDLSVDLCQKNVSWTRVHLVEMPLTDYLKWEMATYDVSAKYGERVLLVDITDEPRASRLRKLTDFYVFDGRAVMAHNYDREGLIKGGWIIHTPEQVTRYQEAAAELIQRALPLGVFEWENGLK